MLAPTLAPEFLHRYLSILGVSQQKPSLAALRELTTAHLVHIPFENISKLYNRKHHGLNSLTPIDLYLEGIERYRFGGTCYSNNFYLYTLLAVLGYNVRLCGADMSKPDVHVVVLATLDRRQYLIDAGYGAPFLAPLPRDLPADYVINMGHNRYILEPQDPNGRSRLAMYQDGRPKHGYLVNPRPRTIDEFAAQIADSFLPTATFLNALMLARFEPGRALVIHNMTVVESKEDESIVHRLSSRSQLVDRIVEGFGIPASIATEVIKELGELQDVWA